MSDQCNPTTSYLVSTKVKTIYSVNLNDQGVLVGIGQPNIHQQEMLLYLNIETGERERVGVT